MDYTITRKMNAYTFTMGNKSFTIDLDKPNEPIIGIGGKPLKAKPKQINENIGDSIYSAYRYSLDTFPGQEMVNRIISLTDENKDLLYRIIANNPNINDDTWKKLLKLFRSGELAEVCSYDTYNIESVIHKYELRKKAMPFGLEYIVNFLNEDDFNFVLSRKDLRQIFRKALKDPYTKIKEKIKAEFFNGLDDDFIRYNYGVWFERYNKRGTICDYNRLLHKCREYLAMMYMDENEYRFSNLETDYHNLKEQYAQNGYRYDNVRFNNHQSEIALNYENEQYKIFVPRSREDLEDIGNHFSNCANGYEWETRLRGNGYYLVTVINKANNCMVVCLDIEAEEKRISQFLGKYNQSVHDNSLLQFKKEYQNYLNTL